MQHILDRDYPIGSVVETEWDGGIVTGTITRHGAGTVCIARQPPGLLFLWRAPEDVKVIHKEGAA